AIAGAIQIKNMLSTSRSAPVYVEVKPGAACIQDPKGFKYIYFQPLEITTTNAAVLNMGLWYSINDSPARRIPSLGGHYFYPGKVSVEREVLPLPASLFLNPDQPLTIKMWAVGETRASFYGNDPRPDLGEVRIAHKIADLLQHKSAYQANNGQFSIKYNLWIADVQWTGQGTSDRIPPPKNLKLSGEYDTFRWLTWEWSGDKNSIDGYILYRSYSCPGMDTQIYAPQMIPASEKEAKIILKSEPMGCAYRYQVSAYGRAGESAPSNALTGNTEAAYTVVAVTFKELKILKMPYGPGGVQLKLYANQHRRLSDIYWVDEASYALNAWNLDGRRPNNGLGLALAQKESLTLSFSVSGVDSQGYVAQDSICKWDGSVPPVGSWSQSKLTYTVTSPNGNCELTIELSAQQPQATSSGGVLHPTADITVTQVARIGNKVFAYIENKGPDDLPNNLIGFSVSWFKILPNGYTEVTGHRYDHDLWAQSNLPQWVHLDDELDKFLAQECKLGSGGSLANCGYMLYVPVWAYGAAQDAKDANFTDPNPDNNAYYDHFERIGMMK
ncbi:MAG: fibronectin type III domain-containing protein, partial [Chloroflexota bacterium]